MVLSESRSVIIVTKEQPEKVKYLVNIAGFTEYKVQPFLFRLEGVTIY